MRLLRGLGLLAALVLTAQDRPAIFRITPVHPVAELRATALAAQPPREPGDFWKSDLVDLAKLDPRIKLEIRYATMDNFLSTPVYTSARAFLQRPAAEAMLQAHRELMKQGYGLLIFDGYRPWYVTRIFWDATPADKHEFVADPSQGSRHNRGCAVDLTLYDLKTGRDGEAGIHRVSIRVVALRLSRLAALRNRERALRRDSLEQCTDPQNTTPTIN